ncbi:5-demethoxyubiquinol-8 5-hydroxylase UbiM [Ideonella azotifigens]|uniref:5-demethoxyubiquinol-8 5-hydroxylase UbiM n=1 Tax=Ideonella azotifigens TaxID=513160 RepID=A0ABP3VLA5_9BURK|nr:5-demethoxyubiquinol-8 5-hydroxylase UbiM [Ideonella azotifigens]MCD2343720.1 5-demethoxyubiquinol-8 5-hydroxylase UbiM [Ideonella azotifigens]
MPHASAASVDVLIAGAGPAGLALAIALARQGLRITVLEQAPWAALAKPAEDGRDIALTHRSRRILEELGIWQRLPAAEIAPLRQAHVHDGGMPWPLQFDARSDGHEALGWLVPNHRLREAAWAVAQHTPGVQVETQACVVRFEAQPAVAVLDTADGRRWQAPLVVAADSRFSALRRMAGLPARSLDFGRTAIVCRVAHTLPHQGIAHECFRYGLTLAMLPMAGLQSSAVLTVRQAEAAGWLDMDDQSFAARLTEQFGPSLGGLHLAGQRHAYPLVAVQALRLVGPRIALIGDAAVGMHPVTAHGFNFGLYGVQTLTREVAAAFRACGDVGDARALQRYAAEHQRTTWPVYHGTNGVAQLFTDDRPAARAARKVVLWLAQVLPPVRRAVTRQLTGATPA